MKFAVGAILLVVAIIASGFAVKTLSQNKTPAITPAPAEEPLIKLNPDQYPQVSLTFSPDAHYATVNISNLHAAGLEYNLIYSAVVKKNKIQAGVNASAKLEGKDAYSKQQLLGSESSGKFTYHENITDAVMELTLRDASGRSIYTATYLFTVSAGKTQDLQPQQ